MLVAARAGIGMREIVRLTDAPATDAATSSI